MTPCVWEQTYATLTPAVENEESHRIDPIDQVPYTFQQIHAYYSSRFTDRDILAYWNDMIPAAHQPPTRR